MQIRKLHENHADELDRYLVEISLERRNWSGVKFAKPGDPSEGEVSRNARVTRRVRCYRRQGLFHVAMFANTDRAKEFRLRLAEIADDVDSGRKGLVSREELDAIVGSLRAQLVEERAARESERADADLAIHHAAALASGVASLMGKRSAAVRKHPEIGRRYREDAAARREIDRQGRLWEYHIDVGGEAEGSRCSASCATS